MLQFSHKKTPSTEIKQPTLKKARCMMPGQPMEIMVIFLASYATDHHSNHKDFHYTCTSVYNISDNENFIYAISEKEFNNNKEFHTEQAIKIFISQTELRLNKIHPSM